MSDIKRINGKYYDFGCKNETFLQTANELKNVGIKNYYFMLRIDNPRVADIDPFKKNITKQEITALMTEFKGNIWSFMRMAVRMRTQAGVVPYGLHRGLAAVVWCFEHGQDCCICEPRQTWKTTGILAGPIQWAFQLSTNLKCHFFGKESGNTKENLATLKADIELLPEWMQFRRYADEDGKIKKSHQATERLENNLLRNSIYIHASAKSLASAQSLGRGGSGNVLYYDEIEHTLFFPEILANSAPLFKTASENAKAAGMPYGRLMSCTPGNLDTKEGRDARPVIKSMIPWSEKIYDMTPEQIEEYKQAYKDAYHEAAELDKTHNTREVINVFYMEYQYFQLRKTYDWVLDQFKLSGDRMAIRREILMQRLRGSTESPLSPEDIEYLISNMKKSTRDLLICDKWQFKLYDHGAGMRFGMPKDLDENIPYIIGIDPASGGGGDNFAITIVNPFNLQIAAEFKSPYLSGPNAVRLLQELIHKYIPKAVLVIERNSMGIYLIQMLLESDIRDNVYWSQNAGKELQQMTEESPQDRQLREMSDIYQKYGTYNSATVRKAMMELLFQYVDCCKDLLCTEYLTNDICKLVRKSTGRIEADKGEHDDCLFSWLHAIYVFHTGDNLETFGIFRQDNPVWRKLEAHENVTADDFNITGTSFDSGDEYKSYDQIVMEDAARMETQIKTLTNTLPFVHDSVYKNTANQHDPLHQEVEDIPAHFFDELNGTMDYSYDDPYNNEFGNPYGRQGFF